MAEEEVDKSGPSIPNICQNIQAHIRQAMVSSKSISSEYILYKKFPSFVDLMNLESKNILTIINSILAQQPIKSDFTKSKSIEAKLESLVVVNDYLLDKVSNFLDEAEGLKEKDNELVIAAVNLNRAILTPQANKSRQSSSSTPAQSPVAALQFIGSKKMPKPQLSFTQKPDNSYDPFVPIIKDKPNSIKPLAVLIEQTDEGITFTHPYEFELEKFEPADELLVQTKPQLPKDINSTPFTYVTNRLELVKMCKALEEASEFAVDLEHHSYRSFQGFTCLIQISTRNEDFIVDALALRDELYLLNQSFTNPKIVKVFHGADMDIVWLQRDFGVYVVNMFDTGQASKLLNLRYHSLLYLMKAYCDKDVDKKYQLADWRIRPLTDDMIRYAREDTHHLLYIYDCMRNQLLSKGNQAANLLRACWDRSKLVCLRKYEKPQLKDDTHLNILRKSTMILNNRQMSALRSLIEWRDKIARHEDESLGYVLPNHMLLQIATILPREQQGILACCNPIPPLVKQHLNEMHLLILKARELSIEKEQVHETVTNVPTTSSTEIDFSRLHDTANPHQEHHNVPQNESADTARTIPDNRSIVAGSDKTAKDETSSLASFFARKTKNNAPEKLNRIFASPFLRYQLFIQDQQKLALVKGTKVQSHTIAEHTVSKITVSPLSPNSKEPVLEEALETKSLRQIISGIREAKEKVKPAKEQKMDAPPAKLTPYQYTEQDMKRLSQGPTKSPNVFNPETKNPKGSGARDRTKKRKDFGKTFGADSKRFKSK